MRKRYLIIPVALIFVLLLIPSAVSYARIEPNKTIATSYLSQPVPANALNLRVYYLQAEYEQGKHKIIKIWTDRFGTPLPEDSPDTTINVPYGVLEIDLKYNRTLVTKLSNNTVLLEDGTVFDRYYVDGQFKLRAKDGTLVPINLNPTIEAFKLTQIYGMTQAQLEAYIDNNVTNLAQAKDYLKKLSAAVLFILKHTDMEP